MRLPVEDWHAFRVKSIVLLALWYLEASPPVFAFFQLTLQSSLPIDLDQEELFAISTTFLFSAMPCFVFVLKACSTRAYLEKITSSPASSSLSTSLSLLQSLYHSVTEAFLFQFFLLAMITLRFVSCHLVQISVKTIHLRMSCKCCFVSFHFKEREPRDHLHSPLAHPPSTLLDEVLVELQTL